MHTKTTTHTEIAHTHVVSDTDTIRVIRIRILTIIPVGAPALGPVQWLVGGWEAAGCNHPDRTNAETNTNTNTITPFNAIQNATVVVLLACVCVCDLFLLDNTTPNTNLTHRTGGCSGSLPCSTGCGWVGNCGGIIIRRILILVRTRKRMTCHRPSRDENCQNVTIK